MKNIYLISVILLILSSCERDNENFEQISINNLIIKSITFNSVEVSGIITDNTNAKIVNGGYYLGKYESVDSVVYKEILNKNFCDTLSLSSNQEYWIQSFIETKTGNTIKGEKLKFKSSDYNIIFEKYITVSHEFENLSNPFNKYDFVDCTLDTDENIVLVGTVGYSPAHPYMVKIDKNGNYLWHNTFTNFPEQWAGYNKIFVSNTSDYLAIYVTWQSLYITKISRNGNFIAYYVIETNKDKETTPAYLFDIIYDKDNDLFTLYSAITEYYSDEHIDFSFKIIKFNSNGNVLENKKINTDFGINQFDGKWYLVDDNTRYCIGHLPNFYSGSIITKVDENMNVLCKKELLGYNIEQLVIRNNNILVVATTYDWVRKFKFFEIDKNLTEFRELSEQWDVNDPYVYDVRTDKRGTTFICGGNSPFLFNSFGALCVISDDNKILYKEQNFGIDSRIGMSNTYHNFIRQMSDNSFLLIGLWNPDSYDGPISKIYLRKFFY